MNGDDGTFVNVFRSLSLERDREREIKWRTSTPRAPGPFRPISISQLLFIHN